MQEFSFFKEKYIDKGNLFLPAKRDSFILRAKSTISILSEIYPKNVHLINSSLENAIIYSPLISLKSIAYKFYKDRMALCYLIDNRTYSSLRRKEYDLYIKDNIENLAYLAQSLNIYDEIALLNGIKAKCNLDVDTASFISLFKRAIFTDDLALIKDILNIYKDYELQSTVEDYILAYALSYGSNQCFNLLLDNNFSFKYLDLSLEKNKERFNAYYYLEQYVSYSLEKSYIKFKDNLKSLIEALNDSKQDYVKECLGEKRYNNIVLNIETLIERGLFLISKENVSLIFNLSNVELIKKLINNNDFAEYLTLIFKNDKTCKSSYVSFIDSLMTDKKFREFFIEYINYHNIYINFDNNAVKYLLSLDDLSCINKLLNSVKLNSKARAYFISQTYKKEHNDFFDNIMHHALSIDLFSKKELDLLLDFAIKDNKLNLKAQVLAKSGTKKKGKNTALSL